MLNVSPMNLLFTVLNLLVLLVLMKKFLYRPVLGVIEKRQELIDEKFAQARASREEGQQMKQQYESCLAQAEAARDEMIKEARTEAAQEYDRVLAEADARAREIIDDARRVSLAEKEKAVKEADDQIVRLAVEAAAKIVQQSSDAESDRRIYEEFLKKAGENNEADRI